MHLKLVGDESTLAVEPGLDIPAIDIDITRYEEKTCTLVAWLQRWQIRKNAFQVTADARREGGTYFSGPTR